MSYPVLLSLCLFFFAAYGIPADNQKEKHGIPADNQNEKTCNIHGDDQNEERDNVNEEPCDIQGDDRIADQTCSVCWDNYPDTSIGVVCPHKFCKGCIDTWKFNKISYRCPLCNHVYDNPDIQADVNVINRELAVELFQNFYYIVRNSNYYNLDHNRTFQETINELVEELNLINTTSDNTGISIMPFEVNNDLNIFAENLRIINRTSPYDATDTSEVTRIMNVIANNIDDYSPVLINTLAEAMRSINTTSENTDDNTAPQERSQD